MLNMTNVANASSIAISAREDAHEANATDYRNELADTSDLHFGLPAPLSRPMRD
jgi:hypothetical protein